MTLIRFFALALLLPALPAVHAQGLRITQVVDQETQLLAFLSTEEIWAPPTAAGGTSLREMKAAFGKVPLPAKDEGAWQPDAPVAVVVAMDVSGSMQSVSFPLLCDVVSNVLTGLPRDSKVALVTIGANPAVKVPFGPASAVIAAVSLLTAGEPETALNEGLQRAQDMAATNRELPLRRFVLLVTDGMDESKKAIGNEETRARLESGDIPIYAAAVVKKEPTRASGLDRFGDVIRASGGSLLISTPVALRDDLKSLMSQALKAEMVAIECGQPCARDGGLRELQVSSTNLGAKLSGVRRTRLLAVGDPVPPPPIVDPPPSKSWFEKLVIQIKIVPAWNWLLIISALCGTATTVYVLRDRIVRTLTTGVRQKEDRVVVVGNRESPKKPSAAAMSLTVDISDVGRQHVSVDASGIVLGRSKDADVSSEDDAEASARHASLYLDKGVLMLRDLNSSNGTYLNGVRIVRSEPVHDRDVIGMGRTDVRVFFGRV
ncbi:FHA domain-containing protein [Ideonella sp. YS5]|uniref:FHA domain-containing protein n=1 Tax=Ideonella sp. YS5 TaxID=3453714 RepID=UPI003EEE8171